MKLKQYKVTTSFIQHGVYLVKAKSKEEAEEIYSDAFTHYEDDKGFLHDSQEEVIDVEEIK